MAELQTKLTTASVTKFLAGIKDERRREDSLAMLAIMKKIATVHIATWVCEVKSLPSPPNKKKLTPPLASSESLWSKV